MKKFFRALVTTTIQFPVILWFFLGISLYRTNDLIFGDTFTFIILFCMVYITFFTSYTIDRYNKFRLTIYLLIPLSLVVMNLFEKSWAAQLLLFLSYIILMGIFLRKERFSVYYQGIDSDISKKVARFDTKKKAKELIKNSINRTLKKLAISVSSDKELIESYLQNRDIQYRVNKKEFNDIEYVKANASYIYQQKLLNMIHGGFKLTEDTNILTLLQDVEDSEVVEVNRLEDSIEIVYIKNAKLKYLSIKDAYYMNSQTGIGSYFEFKNSSLEKGIIKKEYINEEEGLKEYEYLKEQHPNLSDIYSLIKLFYLEDINHISKTGKILIIYKNKEAQTHCAQIFFNDNGIEIDKYENIFQFSTRVLDDKLRTQLEYSYSDKYFEPKKFVDSIDSESKSLIRKKFGENQDEFPCTTFGKTIWFGFDESRGITAYNLASFSNAYQLIDNTVYTYLDNLEREKFHQFLAIAQLYLNTIFVNREFDNELVLDTKEFLENHGKIETFEKNIKNSNWIQEDYYNNSGIGGRYPTRFVYIYSDKNDKKRKFVFLEDTDWIDRKITIKYSNDLRKEINYLINITP